MDPKRKRGTRLHGHETRMEDSGKNEAIPENRGKKEVNKMPRINLDDPKPSAHQRLQVSIYGHVGIGKYTKPGWKDQMNFYLFLCKKHGYVTNNAKGYYERLECPKCFKEAKRK